MKNCPKCNAELNDDVVVCTECGEALEIVEATPVATPKKSVSIILGIVGIVLAFLFPLAGLIVSIIGIVKGVKEKKETGKKKGIIINVIGLILNLVIPVISSILSVVIVLFFGTFIADLIYELGLSDFFIFELIENILYEICLF